jgi:hypothetical protein
VDVELVATPEQLAELTAVGEAFAGHRGVEVFEPAGDVVEPAGGLVVLALELVDEPAPFRPGEAAGLLLELSGQPFETTCQDLAALVELVAGVQELLLAGDVDRIDPGVEVAPLSGEFDASSGVRAVRRGCVGAGW